MENKTFEKFKELCSKHQFELQGCPRCEKSITLFYSNGNFYLDTNCNCHNKKSVPKFIDIYKDSIDEKRAKSFIQEYSQ